MRVKRSKDKCILLFFCILLLDISFLSYQIFNLVELKNYFRMLAALLLCVLSVLECKKKPMDKFQVVLFGITMIVNVLNGFALINFVFILLFVNASKSISFKRVINSFFYERIITLIIYLLLVISGNIEMRYDMFDVTRKARLMLGFSNVNAAAGWFFSFFLLWVIYIYQKNKSVPCAYLLGGIGCFVLYSLTDTRTLLILYLIFGVCIIIFKRMKIRWKKILLFVPGLFSLFGVLYFIILGNNEYLDRLSSYRITAQIKYIENKTIGEFILGGAGLDVDNFYLCVLFAGGGIMYICIMGLIQKGYRWLVLKQECFWLSVITMLLVGGVLESTLIRPEDASCLLFWYVIYYLANKRGDFKLNEKESNNCL